MLAVGFVKARDVKFHVRRMIRFLWQDVYTIPGFDKVFNGASMMKLHNLAVEQGAMQQLLLWLSLLEIISGVPALIQVPPTPLSVVSQPLLIRSLNAADAERLRAHPWRFRLRPARLRQEPGRLRPPPGVRSLLAEPLPQTPSLNFAPPRVRKDADPRSRRCHGAVLGVYEGLGHAARRAAALRPRIADPRRFLCRRSGVRSAPAEPVRARAADAIPAAAAAAAAARGAQERPAGHDCRGGHGAPLPPRRPRPDRVPQEHPQLQEPPPQRPL